jgi:hypothetical protein
MNSHADFPAHQNIMQCIGNYRGKGIDPDVYAGQRGPREKAAIRLIVTDDNAKEKLYATMKALSLTDVLRPRPLKGSPGVIWAAGHERRVSCGAFPFFPGSGRRTRTGRDPRRNPAPY